MSDPILEALWAKVLEEWGEDHVHQAFVRHCADAGELGEAAARYKSRTHPDGEEHDDEEQADARKRLGGIVILALAAVERESEEARARKMAGPSKTWLNCVAIVVLVGLLLAIASVLW